MSQATNDRRKNEAPRQNPAAITPFQAHTAHVRKKSGTATHARPLATACLLAELEALAGLAAGVPVEVGGHPAALCERGLFPQASHFAVAAH